MQSAVQGAQLDASVGKVKNGFPSLSAVHFPVSIARPPPNAKIISASLTSGIAISLSTFS